MNQISSTGMPLAIVTTIQKLSHYEKARHNSLCLRIHTRQTMLARARAHSEHIPSVFPSWKIRCRPHIRTRPQYLQGHLMTQIETFPGLGSQGHRRHNLRTRGVGKIDSTKALQRYHANARVVFPGVGSEKGVQASV